MNVHFHVLALDGVYVRDKTSGRLVFHALGTPSRAEVATVAARTAERIEKILRKAGRLLDPEMEAEPPELARKSVWKNGTRAIVFAPEDLVLRLIAAIPPPRWHLVRYFGILSSHCRNRKEVVPRSSLEPAAFHPPPCRGDQLELGFDLNARDDELPPHRSRWAWLLAHVFRADVDTCVRCGGPMRWVEAAATAKSAARLLAKLGLAPQPPPEPRAAMPGQLWLRFGD